MKKILIIMLLSIGLLATDDDSEFGIGYIMNTFKARQYWGVSLGSISGMGHGADIYYNKNYNIGESFGFTFGTGVELINIAWREPLYELYCMYNCSIDEAKSDFLWNVYLNAGVFKDIWQNYVNSVRIFANVGVAVNFLFGGLYDRTISCSGSFSYLGSPACDTKLNTRVPISLPFSIGLRFMFVENHSLELVGKYDVIRWDYTTSISGASVPNFETNIHRNLGVALRYVFSF